MSRPGTRKPPALMLVAVATVPSPISAPENKPPPPPTVTGTPKKLRLATPPFATVSVPMLPPPIWTPPLTFVHTEPGPVTVTSPLVKLPMTAPVAVVSEPPFCMVRLPSPNGWPRTRDCATAGTGPAITVGLTGTWLRIALVADVGTPAVQLPAINQFSDIAPVQLVVWARVDTVETESNAITAVVVSKASLLLFEHALCYSNVIQASLLSLAIWSQRVSGWARADF